MSALITRKDIAALLGSVTAVQVRNNEKRWGLDKARVYLNPRCVRYRARLALLILRQRGFVD